MVLDGPGDAPRRILIVDDDAEARIALCALVRMWGHEAVDVPTVSAALDALSWFRPDVAVVDLHLQDTDGCDLARVLRARTDCPLLIAHSGDERQAVRERARAAGFDVFLLTPEGIDALETTLSGPLFRRRSG